MKNKERILEVATALFNEQGTATVSTNHIADAAGISPGNLYYHYRNKAEIIRAIFEQVFALWDVTFALPENAHLDVEMVQALIQANFRIMHQYRFIYREIIALLNQDAALHERYVAIRGRGYEGFHEVVAALSAVGVTVPLDDERVTHLADLCWLISEFWLASLEVSGQPIDDAAMQRGIDLMKEVLRPYLVT